MIFLHRPSLLIMGNDSDIITFKWVNFFLHGPSVLIMGNEGDMVVFKWVHFLRLNDLTSVGMCIWKK